VTNSFSSFDCNFGVLLGVAEAWAEEFLLPILFTVYLEAGRFPNSFFVDGAASSFPQMDVWPSCCFGRAQRSKPVRQSQTHIATSGINYSKRRETSVSPLLVLIMDVPMFAYLCNPRPAQTVPLSNHPMPA
jgi:hypothetical protein